MICYYLNVHFQGQTVKYTGQNIKVVHRHHIYNWLLTNDTLYMGIDMFLFYPRTKFHMPKFYLLLSVAVEPKARQTLACILLARTIQTLLQRRLFFEALLPCTTFRSLTEGR